MRKIEIFDSTLRDGEQAPGFSMNINEKLTMASMLEQLNVDVIEAGFAVASNGDFASVKAVAEQITEDVQVASLCRCRKEDVDTAWEAISCAKHPLIHIFIASSDLHLEHKLKMTREEVKQAVKETVSYAVTLCENVQFSAEDATRADREFLKELLQIALDNGAKVVNMADTVGYIQPAEMKELVKFMKENLKSDNEFKLGVHCHNDLGLAVANTLAAIEAGVDRVDVTVNGIGERAGNAALEEVVMALRTRKDLYNADTRIDSSMIVPSSKKLEVLTGTKVQPNKAIVGKNAFLHESGIHQHGIIENRETYEIIKPEDIGLCDTELVMGKHSGKHALEDKLNLLGFVNLRPSQVDKVFEEFKIFAETKKEVSDNDIRAIVKNSVLNIPPLYTLDKYVINSGNILSNTCNIRILENGETPRDGFASGDGPIDAAYNAINVAIGKDVKLINYGIESVTGGTDAQGAVKVKIMYNGETHKGYGIDVNIFEASISAYLNALNKTFGRNR